MQDIQDIQGKNQLKEEILAAVNKIFHQARLPRSILPILLFSRDIPG